MRKEYDFRDKKGVRGKYYKAMQEGHKTIIHKSDGSTVVREYRPIYSVNFISLLISSVF